MSFTINSSTTTQSLLPSNSTASSAGGATGFSISLPASFTSMGPATTSEVSSSNGGLPNISQLSADIQSLLTQLQANSQPGTGQGPDGGSDCSASEASGLASTNGSATNSATALQSDVNNVVNDLFSLLSAASTAGATTPAATSNTLPIASTGFAASTSTTDTQASTTTTASANAIATPSLADLLAQDFAQAIQNYASTSLQTGVTNQLITAA
jgi:hypothetical protein